MLSNWILRRETARISLAVVLFSINVWQTMEAAPRKRLSDAQLIAVPLASGAFATACLLVPKPDSTSRSLIPNPLPGDRSIERNLGGKWYPGKTNFLDRRFGSAATPMLGGLLLCVIDLKYDESNARIRNTLQDAVLFASGIAVTEGLTQFTKRIVARKRPFLTLEPELAATRSDTDVADERESFFSGHSSSAFFTMSYLNKRIRQLMRERLDPNAYSHWCWAPPAIAYGWATFVAWSRIQVYKHYFSDLLAGAIVGTGVGELFFRLGEGGGKFKVSASPIEDRIVISYYF